MAQTIGYATLQVIPSLKGVSGGLERELGGPLIAAGRTAGRGAAQAIANEMKTAEAAAKKAADEVAKASAAVEKSRAREADAAGKVRVAEAQLESLRTRGVTDAGRLAAAEEKVATARRNAKLRSDEAAGASTKLATAEKNLEQRTREVGKAQEDKSKKTRDSQSAMQSASGVADALSGKLKGLAGAAGAAAAGFAGWKTVKSLFTAGWGRLSSIDDAQGLLTSLGHTAESTAEIMDNAMASVKGTSYGFGDAATIAASAVAAGVEPGKELTRYLGRIADAATIAGTDLSEMGDILNKVQTSGQVYALELNQLAKRGVPIYSWIADEAGVAAGEVKKLASEGGISAEMYFAAIDKHIEGAATAATTVSSASANMRAAWSRLGAEIMTPIFDQAIDGFVGLTAVLDAATAGVKPFTERLGAGLNLVKGIFLEADFKGEFGSILGIEEDAPIVDTLFKIREGMQTLGSESFDKLGSIFGSLKDGAIALVDPILQIGQSLGTAFGTAGISIWKSLLEVFDALAPVLVTMVVPPIELLSTLMTENQGVVNALVFAYTGYKAAVIAATVVQTALNSAFMASPLGRLVAVIGLAVAGITLLYQNSETFRNIVHGAWDAVKTVISGAWENVIKPVFSGIVDAGKAIGEAAVGLWQNGIVPAWEGIKSAISSVWTGFLQPTFEAFATAGRAVGDAAMWLWQNAIVPAWEGIKSFVSAVYDDWIKPVLENWVILGGIVGDAVMAMWNNYISPAWEGIKSAISAAYDGVIRPVLDAISAAFTWVGETATALWNDYIVPAWQGIASAVQTVWDSTVSVVTGAIDTAFTKVGEVASWLYNEAIRPAWDGIKSAVSSVWEAIQPIFGKIGEGMEAIGSIASSVASGIKAAFSGVVDVLKAPIRYIGQLLTRIPAKVGPFNVPGAASLNSWGETLQALRSGGVVAGRRPDGMLYGPGTGTSDSILGVDTKGVPTALVSANEFVVNAKSTAENLPLLKMINAGWVPSAEFLRALVFEGDFRDTGVKIDESSDFVARMLGARSLIVDGDYTGNVYDGFGIDEDDARIARVLGLRSLLVDGDYTGNMYDGFGIDEDHAIVDAILTGRDAALLAHGSFTGAGFDTNITDPRLMNAAINAGAAARAVWDRLPRFAEGGLVSADDLVDFAKGVEGAPYVWGGVNWGDCSGAVSALANFATGRAPFASRFATGTQKEELAKRGFLPGLGPEGSLNVGWYNGGPYGGHTSATLPNGVNFEMGGARGDGQYGGMAAPADDPQYTNHAHLPPDFFVGGDLGSPTFGGTLESGVSWSLGGGSGASVGGGSSIGGSSSSSSSGGKSLGVALVDATPVFVVNWPSGGAGGFGGSGSGSGGSGSTLGGSAAGGDLGASTGGSSKGSSASFTPDTLAEHITGMPKGSFTPETLAEHITGVSAADRTKFDEIVAFNDELSDLAGLLGAGEPVDPYDAADSLARLAKSRNAMGELPWYSQSSKAADVFGIRGDALAIRDQLRSGWGMDPRAIVDSAMNMQDAFGNLHDPNRPLLWSPSKSGDPASADTSESLVEKLADANEREVSKLHDVLGFAQGAADMAAMFGTGAPVDPYEVADKASDMLKLGGRITDPDEPLFGGKGVDTQYGAGESGDPEVDKWGDWAKNAAGQWESFFKDHWREMVNTAVGVGLGGIGGGGGDTYNITGPDPNAVGRVIARHQRRRSVAMQRIGGFGR